MKQIEKSQKVKDLIAKALGTDTFDESKFAVFETVAINTLPLQKGGVYNGAVLTEDTVKEMAAALNKENFVPLHLNHRQAGELPAGRTFAGKTTERVGKGGKKITDLHALFYISNGTPQGAALIDGLDTGTINEVSVGMYPKSVKCSKCQFDYMKDGSFMNWLDATCANDHKIGEKGVHAVLDGLSRFMELSLVSLGAADHARVLSPTQSIMASVEESGDVTKLAASNTMETLSLLIATKGTEINMATLSASEVELLLKDFKTRGAAALEAKHEGITALVASVKEGISMDEAKTLRENFATELETFSKSESEPKSEDALKEQVVLSLDTLIEAKAAQKLAEAKTAELTAQITDLTNKLAETQTQVTQLTAQVSTLSSIESELTSAKDFLKLSCQSLLVAAGVTNGVIPDAVSDLIASIKVSQAKLSKLPVGGLSLSAETTAKTGSANAAHTADVYRTRK